MLTGCYTKEQSKNASASRVQRAWYDSIKQLIQMFAVFLYLAHKATGKSSKHYFHNNTKTLVIYINILKIFKIYLLLLYYANFECGLNNIYFFPPQKVKKPPQKVAFLWQLRIFFSAAPTAQNSQELHFHFINSFTQTSLVGSLVDSDMQRCISELTQDLFQVGLI